MKGLPEPYWQHIANSWSRTAFICRYGHQNVYQVLGRDPIKEPLTILESELFYQALLDHVVAEFEAKGGGLVENVE